MQKSPKALLRFLDSYYRLTAILCSLVLACITLIITAEVLVRLFFNKSIQFVMQFSGYSLYIVTFLGAAWVLREGSHITMDFVTARFSERTRHIISIVMHGLAIVLCLFLFYQTALYTYGAWIKGMATDYPIVFPLAYLMILMPIGCFFLAIEFLVQTWEKVSNRGREVFYLRKEQAANGLNPVD